MVLPSSNRRRYVVIVNVCRWLLALVLMLSGFLKAVDPVGAAHKLQEYASAFSFVGVSDAWLLAAAVGLSVYNLLQRHLTKTYTGMQTETFICRSPL